MDLSAGKTRCDLSACERLDLMILTASECLWFATVLALIWSSLHSDRDYKSRPLPISRDSTKVHATSPPAALWVSVDAFIC